MDYISQRTVSPDCPDSSSIFWRHQANDSNILDASLRSIIPHIVRSRLLLFNNVLVDQKQSLAIHNIRTHCTLDKRSMDSAIKDCGAIHFGFCRAVEEKQLEDVQSQIRRFDILDSNNNGEPPEEKRFTRLKVARSNLKIKLVIPLGQQLPQAGDKRSSPVKSPARSPIKTTERDKTQVSVSQSLVVEDGDTTLQIPPFWFPLGRPSDGTPLTDGAPPTDPLLLRAEEFLQKYEDGRLPVTDKHDFTKAIGLPKYWAVLIYNAVGAKSQGKFTFQSFSTFWKSLTSVCHDEVSRFVKLLAKPGQSYLEHEDLVPFVQDVVDTHPGLQFLQDAIDFHSRYVHCVISRIFYNVNTNWSGRISIPELRRSNLLQTIVLLEEEDDINQITDFFSYEHFYVIYCKFWELDKDHDLFIDKHDLARHNEHALSSRIIDRIFSGAVTRLKKNEQDGKMSYTDFVSFLLSEEDKKTDKSIEFWFRCMDLDGDGIISMFEMEHFYEEQIQKMEEIGIEPLPFNDLLCQMLDMIAPKIEGQISLADLKNSKQAYMYFDTMFNLEKYLDHEQRDPFSTSRDIDGDGPEPSDWEKYAREEYELLVAEEANEDQASFDYDDDFESEAPEDEVNGFTPPPLSDVMSPGANSGSSTSPGANPGSATSVRKERPKSAKSANSEPQDT